ncbi:MAG: exodeoxyribonuclease VII large subunit [Coprobacillaceae bacterium]
MEKRYLTVSALNKYIKSKIDQDSQLQRILIKGEISNFKHHSSGHLYFTLIDENSRINAVMFSSKASKVPFAIENGMKVLIEASVSVYDIAGTYQLYVNTVEQDGIGNLFLQFEMLKKKLSSEGLFDEQRKKRIPKYPSKIAVLSANKSAALMDIIRTIHLRFPVVRVVVFPVPVQGKDAYKEIVETLTYVDSLKFSTILIARGGGSLEDLWNFNEEQLARTIANCQTPIISGVGHEVDFTICDFVADARAATPTAAATLATPDLQDLQQTISNTTYTLQTLMKQKVHIHRERLEKHQSFYLFKNPDKLFEDKKARILFLEEQMNNTFNRTLALKKQYADTLLQKFKFQTNLFVVNQRNKINQYEKQLDSSFSYKYKNNQEKFFNLLSRLNTLSPLKTLERGYAIVTNQDEVIVSKEQVQTNDEITIKFKDGKIKAIVK